MQSQQGDDIDFAPVSLTTLVDSPVLAGEYFRTIALAPDVQPPHRLNIAADSAAALEIPADQIVAYSRLVREEGALFGARHYDHYDFLLSLTELLLSQRARASPVQRRARPRAHVSQSRSNRIPTIPCSRTNSRTPGTASIAGRPAWPPRITSSP